VSKDAKGYQMKKRFSEEQIIQMLAEIRAGKSVKELSRQHGITLQTIYTWKSKFGDMSTSEAQKLRSLEQENARLKRLVADLSLDNQILKDVNSKKW
jgi:putative transposase